jgi:hypothetical protein
MSDMAMLGEIITPEFPGGAQVLYADVRNALVQAGLDESVAKEIVPRGGFARAIRAMAQKKLAEHVETTNGTIYFQISKRVHLPRQLDYVCEHVVSLDVNSGQVLCMDKDVQRAAQESLDTFIKTRRRGELNAIVEKLMTVNADMFPLKTRSGVWFVPSVHAPYLEKVHQMVVTLGGTLGRFQVPAGAATTVVSVKTVVQRGLREVLESHQQKIAKFTEETRVSTWAKHLAEIKATQLKVEGYAMFLDDQKAALATSLAEMRAVVQSKLASMAEPESDELFNEAA